MTHKRQSISKWILGSISIPSIIGGAVWCVWTAAVAKADLDNYRRNNDAEIVKVKEDCKAENERLIKAIEAVNNRLGGIDGKIDKGFDENAKSHQEILQTVIKAKP